MLPTCELFWQSLSIDWYNQGLGPRLLTRAIDLAALMGLPMYADRRSLLSAWESERGGKALLYVTGDRPNLETQMHPEVLDFFVQHLDHLRDVERITLFLHTRGGQTLAAWSIANLIRQFCSTFEIVVPFKAHSAGTLLCLGADSIMMTKQATLGPIDPSVNGPLNPHIPGAPDHIRNPVSTEAIHGFIDFAKSAGISSEPELKDIFLALCRQVHPLVLGEVFRSRSQIRMLAKRLIARQVTDSKTVEKVLDFLCSESGSHDYTISRQEARDDLGLKVERPNDRQYERIKAIYDDVSEELLFKSTYNQDTELGAKPNQKYSLKRSLIESVDGGSHCFVSEGELVRTQIEIKPGVKVQGVADHRKFEGWRHESVQK